MPLYSTPSLDNQSPLDPLSLLSHFHSFVNSLSLSPSLPASPTVGHSRTTEDAPRRRHSWATQRPIRAELLRQPHESGTHRLRTYYCGRSRQARCQEAAGDGSDLARHDRSQGGMKCDAGCVSQRCRRRRLKLNASRGVSLHQVGRIPHADGIGSSAC